MKKRIGILTSGGDCPGLNATIRGVAKACYEKFGEDVQIVGIEDGYYGLINNMCKEMKQSDFSGILTTGGTIFGTKRTPFKKMQVIEEDNVDKVKAMKETYKKQKLDCLLTLGGNGTHKTANLLSTEGLNVIGLPKTIDNDIQCSEYTIGYDTAMNTVMELVDKLRDTSHSHERCAVVEVMGRNAGHIALNTGVACGATAILVPEIEFDIEDVIQKIKNARANGKEQFIVIVAEGVGHTEEISKRINEETGIESRATILGHVQRGGSPTVRDRVVASEMGYYAVELLEKGIGNRVVGMKDGKIYDVDIQEALSMKKPFDKRLYDIANEISF